MRYPFLIQHIFYESPVINNERVGEIEITLLATEKSLFITNAVFRFNAVHHRISCRPSFIRLRKTLTLIAKHSSSPGLSTGGGTLKSGALHKHTTDFYNMHCTRIETGLLFFKTTFIKSKVKC